MIQRLISPLIRQYLHRYPVLILFGARQTGKTTLANMVLEYHPEAQYFNLERTSDFRLFAKPEKLLQGLADTLVIIDGFQRRVSLLDQIYALTKNQQPGCFLLLSSEPFEDNPTFIQGYAEGHIGYLQVPALVLQEILSVNISMEQHWMRGGFAGSIFATTDRQSLSWREQYVAASLERQTPALSLVVTPYQLRLFWLSLAHEHGTVWNASGVARIAGFSPPTATTYRQILEKKMIVRALPAFLPKHTHKRLAHKPVLYIRDSGLFHAALKLHNREKALAQPGITRSWKGYVVEQIITTLDILAHHHHFEYWHYRTQDGAECDLVITKAGVPALCVCAQWAGIPRFTKKFSIAVRDLKAIRNVIIVPENDGAFPIAPSVYGMSLSEFFREFLPLI